MERCNEQTRRTCIWLQNIGEEVEDLAAGKSLCKRLDGMLPVQEDYSISGLHQRTVLTS